MSVESSFNYPSDLNASYPAATDSIPEGDDHIRGLKTCLKTTFPNVSGAITPTHTVLNYMLGVTSAVQTQLDTLTSAKAPKANPTFTGTVVLPADTSIDAVSATEIGYLNGVTSAIQTQINTLSTDKAPLASPALTGTPTAPTATAGTGTTQIATCAFVAATSFSTNLPAQTGNSGKYITTDGSNASWDFVGHAYAARTSNTILGVADRGDFIEVTSGTFSQTFDAAATLGDRWYCWIKNSGTGVVTLDPNGAELIDGAATVAVYQGETRLIQCTGTALRTVLTNGVGIHEVTVHTGNGHGAVNTKIRRFTTAMTNTGTAITYADSANNGASFTVNETGIYAIHYSDGRSDANYYFGVSVNSAELTTDVESIAVANRIAINRNVTAGVASTSTVVRLTAGDVVRPHTAGNVDVASNLAFFSISKVAYV